MSKINTLRYNTPKEAQRKSPIRTSVSQSHSSNRLLFGFIFTFLNLFNSSIFAQCVAIPSSPVIISGEPYISTFSSVNLNGTGSTAATALPGSSVSISYNQVMSFSG